MSRACEGKLLFRNPQEFASFKSLLLHAFTRFELPLLAYCLMPTHWHAVALARREGQLSKTLHWLLCVHAMQVRRQAGNVGKGAVYQSRFRSVLIEKDYHLLVAIRYVERNALRANLVERAEDWEWGSLHARTRPDSESARALADQAPLPSVESWIEIVNSPHGAAEEEAFRQSVRRGIPFGSPEFVAKASQSISHDIEAPLSSS